MPWSCHACTFDNVISETQVCAICGTKRSHCLSVTENKLTNKVLDLSGDLVEQVEPSLSVRHRGKEVTKNLSQVTNQSISQKSPTQRTLFGGLAAAPVKRQGAKSSKKTEHKLETNDFTKHSHTIAKQSVDCQRKVSRAPFETLQKQAHLNMKALFGVEKLRNQQPIAIELALKRKSQIIVMATGAGKSLCYQLPASVLGGVTLVISPLIALMVDQVKALNDKGIPAAMLSSASGEKNNNLVLERLLGRSLKAKKGMKDTLQLSSLRLLYCTPELIQTNKFRDILIELHKDGRIALIAVDEAHCLSTWGHDFRPAYRRLTWLSSLNIPIMACTATATAKVIQDIRDTLALPEGEVPCHLSSFNRPNISYEVRFKDSLDALKPGGALNDLVALVKSQHAKAGDDPCSGIIYVHKREDTTFIASQIRSIAKIPAAAYHAGLKDGERSQVQQDWTLGTIKVAVATVAFGMGIDLGHVRYVLHWSMAKTVEGFYQESGRAGRDGQSALSVLYYSKEDASRFSYVIRKSLESKAKSKDLSEKREQQPLRALESMINYCIIPGCRRHYLLSHFGEKIDPKIVCCKTCDYCQNPTKVQKAIQASDVMKDVVSSISSFSNRAKENSYWDGQWNGPHDSDFFGDNESHENIWKGDLCITSDYDDSEIKAFDLGSQSKKRKGIDLAKTVLDRYEMMERNDGGKGAFVSFRSKADVQVIPQKPIEIPSHLRKGLPDPFDHLAKKGSKLEAVSSNELALKAQQLRENIEKLKQQSQSRLLALQAKSTQSLALSKGDALLPPPPPPPPTLKFKKSRR